MFVTPASFKFVFFFQKNLCDFSDLHDHSSLVTVRTVMVTVFNLPAKIPLIKAY